MKEIGNALFKRDVPLILCHAGQLSLVGLINILFQRWALSSSLKLFSKLAFLISYGISFQSLEPAYVNDLCSAER